MNALAKGGRQGAAPKSAGSQDAYRGDHYVPVVGQASVNQFVSGAKLEKIFAKSKESLARIFNFTSSMVSSTQSGNHGGFACAVSDPNADDCPLVYISKGFDDLTGYPADFSCGRSCRFLQPISAVINDAFNLGERKRMREFCTTIQRPGTQIVNLLLNEKYSGER